MEWRTSGAVACGRFVVSFKADFAKLIEKAGERAEDVVRKTALQLQTSMVERSPVLTGRFKNNWQCGLDAVNVNIGAVDDAIGRTSATLPSWKAGQTIFLTNSLPYARRLENGWSKQAPSGVVRLTVQNYAQALSEAVKGIK